MTYLTKHGLLACSALLFSMLIGGCDIPPEEGSENKPATATSAIVASITIAPLALEGDSSILPGELSNAYTPRSIVTSDIISTVSSAMPFGTPALAPLATVTNVPLQGVPQFSTQYSMNDGLILYGEYTTALNTPAPLVVLLPDVGGSKADFSGLGAVLAGIGFNVLALDPRGSGETGSTFTPTLAISDLNLVMQQVVTAQSIDPARVVLIGAGVNANIALNQCVAGNVPCRSLVLLSPTLTGGGIDAVKQVAAYGARPLLLVAARGDDPSGRDSLRLNGLVQNSSPPTSSAQAGSRLILENGTARGTALLAASPDLITQIAAWVVASVN